MVTCKTLISQLIKEIIKQKGPGESSYDITETLNKGSKAALILLDF